MAVFATSFTYITLPHRSSYAIIGNFIDVEKLYANVSGLFVRPYYCAGSSNFLSSIDNEMNVVLTSHGCALPELKPPIIHKEFRTDSLAQGGSSRYHYSSSPRSTDNYHESTDIDDEPGPGSYSLPASMGPQFESRMVNAPSLSFQCKDGWDKVTISKHHLQERMGTQSPGPAVYDPPRSRTSTGTRFGKSRRPKILFPMVPESTPGCVYDQDSTLVHPTLPVGIFPRTGRDIDTLSARQRSSSELGPGSYDSDRSSLSNKAFSFGEPFSAYRKVCIPGCDRENLGRTCATLGISLRFMGGDHGQSFTRSARDSSSSLRRKTSEPKTGPGCYELDSSRERPVVSFGKPSSRPRLDFRKLAKVSKSYWLA